MNKSPDENFDRNLQEKVAKFMINCQIWQHWSFSSVYSFPVVLASLLCPYVCLIWLSLWKIRVRSMVQSGQIFTIFRSQYFPALKSLTLEIFCEFFFDMAVFMVYLLSTYDSVKEGPSNTYSVFVRSMMLFM